MSNAIHCRKYIDLMRTPRAKAFMESAFAVFFVSSLVSPVFSYAGEVKYGGLFQGWEPSGCHKPFPPSLYSYSSYSRSYAIDAYNDYVTEINLYIDCLSRQSKQDSGDVRAFIFKEAQQKADEAIAEAKRLKATLPY